MALRAIRSNLLRSVLTVLIIAVGIMALVGILTAFDILKGNVTESFSSLGANSFQISSEVIKRRRTGSGAAEQSKPISYAEATAFREQFGRKATVGISATFSGTLTARYGEQATNPNVSETGVEAAYFDITDTRLAGGRIFSPSELQEGRYVCVLGYSIAQTLMPNSPMELLDKDISVGNTKYHVVGIAAVQGGSMRMNADNLVLVPLENARMLKGTSKTPYLISVAVSNPKMRDFISEEAEGAMRVIRKQEIDEPNSFAISSNETMMASLLKVLDYLLGAAIVIAVITLLGSVVGLMNIMLVSVAERTREIGVSKALGARAATIRRQFLLESILIGLMGGALGIMLGLAVGNIVGLVLHSGFVVPWLWMGLAIGLCLLAGILSGIYPALKASRLNPIDALRYE